MSVFSEAELNSDEQRESSRPGSTAAGRAGKIAEDFSPARVRASQRCLDDALPAVQRRLQAASGDRLVREKLCHEAIRLAQLLAEHPATSQPCIHALLALMLLNAARLPARIDDSGNLLRQKEQNPSAWNQTRIQRVIQHLALAATGEALSEYHLESYHLYHAVRGAFAAELGRNTDAILHFRKAETLATLPSEREFINRRTRECGVTNPI
ncbi:MAG: DUF6596 domain-containing protein [Verrucomicrobiota bacterium]